jgi:signal transduction histidine kinase
VVLADLIGIVFLGDMPPSKKNVTDLFHSLVLGEENEREHIAKNIHQVNTLLSLVKMNMKKAAKNSANKKLLEQLAQENYKVLEESMRLISVSVRELSPPMFARIGFMAAFSELCRKASADGKKVELEIQSSSGPDLDPQCGLQLYRLCKELLACLFEASELNAVFIVFCKKKKGHE